MTKGGEPFEGPKVDPRTQDIYFTNEDELDPDVMASMSSLGCFKDREQLVAKLLSNEECTEKYVYQLLLRRKGIAGCFCRTFSCPILAVHYDKPPGQTLEELYEYRNLVKRQNETLHRSKQIRPGPPRPNLNRTVHY